jgi:hypothetical protein
MWLEGDTMCVLCWLCFDVVYMGHCVSDYYGCAQEIELSLLGVSTETFRQE